MREPARTRGTERRRPRVVAMLAVAAIGATSLAVLSPALADAAAATIVSRGAATTGTFSSATSMTVAAPAATQAGDVLVASVAVGNPAAKSQPTLTAPSGWSLVRRTSHDSRATIAVYSHVTAGAEGAYTWTSNSSVGGVVSVAAFGGVDQTSPVDTSTGRETGGGQTINPPALNTRVANEMLVASYLGYHGSTPASWSVPTGMNELSDQTVSGRTASVDAVTQASVGSTGNKVATASTKQDYMVATLVALRPATVTTTTTTTTTIPVPPGATPLIIDSDIFSSVDDVGAFAVAYGAQLHGEARVIAMTMNTRTSRPTVATDSWRCTAAINQYYGAGSVPIGTHKPDNSTGTNVDDFLTPCARMASSVPTPDTAVNVLRRALAGQADGSVAIASIGYLQNLADLLSSPADAISPLTGRDLVARKVKSLVVMGGKFPTGSENNIIGDPVSAQTVSQSWPSKIVWSGYEVGDAVHNGDTISRTHPANSPVRVSYEAFVGANNWYYSYDLTAVYHAIRPNDPLLTEQGPGYNVISSNGSNTWVSGAGNQYYLKLGNATALGTAMEQLIDTLPTTVDHTPPVISGLSAVGVSSSSINVRWTTDEPATSMVPYAVTGSPSTQTITDPTLMTAHSVTITGLQAATSYTVQAASVDAFGNVAASAALTASTLPASTPTGPKDTFDGPGLSAAWTTGNSGSTVSVVSQSLQINHPGGAWTSGYAQTVTPFDETGRMLQLQMLRAANDGKGGSQYGETSVFLWADATHYAYFFVAGGSLTAWIRNGATETNLTPSWPAYSATSMQWLRFRESGGSLFWDYAGGATAPGAWTTLAGTALPFPVTAVTMRISAGSSTTAADAASFDNVSTL